LSLISPKAEHILMLEVDYIIYGIWFYSGVLVCMSLRRGRELSLMDVAI